MHWFSSFKSGPYVDVIELGTPLIKQEGLSVVKYVKAAYPDKLVFADLKTMDTGELEADLALNAARRHDGVDRRVTAPSSELSSLPRGMASRSSQI